MEYLLGGLVLAVIAIAVWRTWLRQQATRRWPAAVGEVLRAGLLERDDGSNSGEGSLSFALDLEYEYRVGGVAYRGTRVRIVAPQFRDRAAAKAALARYAPGMAVNVFYDPAAPAQSVLERG